MTSDDGADLHDQARARLRAGIEDDRARAESGVAVPLGAQDRARPRDLVGPAQSQARELYQEAMEALEREAPEAAEDALRRSLSREDGHLATWRELALLLAAGRRHEECLRAADQLLSRDPEDLDGRRLRAQALDGMGDGEGAAAAWEHLLASEDTLPESFRRQAHARLERLAPAEVPAETRGFAANRMPRLEPPRPTGPGGEAGVAYEEAVAALEEEQPEVAEAALRRSLSRDDGPPEAWRELGLLLVDLERLEEAMRPLREALRRAPDDLESQRGLAVAADRTGDITQAALAYTAFLEACPETSFQRQRLHAERRLAALERGEVDLAPGSGVDGVVELRPGWSPAAQGAALGALGLVLVLWLIFGGGGGGQPPPPARTAGPPRAQREFLAEADALIPGAGAPLTHPADLVTRARSLMEAGAPKAAQVVSILLGHPDGAVVAGVVDVLAEDAGAGARAALSLHIVSSHAREERASVEAALAALTESQDPRRALTLVRALAVAARRGARSRHERAHIGMLEAALGELPREEVAAEARGHLIRSTPARGNADRLVQEAMRPWVAH